MNEAIEQIITLSRRLLDASTEGGFGTNEQCDLAIALDDALKAIQR